MRITPFGKKFRFTAIVLIVGVSVQGATPSIALPDFKAELKVPALRPITFAIPTPRDLIPERPAPAFRIPWRCNCGGLGFVLNVPEGAIPLDPLPQVSEAYRKAEWGEVWVLDSSIDILSSPTGTWDGYSHRGVAITHVRRFDDSGALAALFRLCVDLVSDEPDESYFWGTIEASMPIDSAIHTLAFSPDVVISIGGEAIVRVEAQLSEKRVLFHGPHSRGFYTLAPTAEEYVRRLLAELRAEPSQRNAGIRPFSDDSSGSETPSLPQPRD